MKLSLVIRIIAGGILMALMLTPTLFSQVPPTITYQGRLLDNAGAPITGTYDISFRIISTKTGTDVVVWESGPQSILVAEGLFNYELGSAVPLPDDIFAGDTTGTLGIKIGSDPEIAPRTSLHSVAFAFHSLRSDTAGYASSVADNSVSGDKIASGAISAPHIINGAVTSAKIQDNTILLSDLAQNGATIGQVISWNGSSWEMINSEGDISSVTAGEGLSGGGNAGDISLSIGYNSVTSAMIKDDVIATEDIAPNAIIGSRIADGAVGTADLGNNAVNSSKIQDASITAADLGASSVYSTEIADGTILTADLANSAVTSAKIADGTIVAADLAANSVQASEIASGAVGSSEIAANAVGTSEIVDNSITAIDLATNSVAAAEIATGAVGTSEIADATIVDTDISGAANITPSKVQGTAATLSATSNIFTGKIGMGSSGASKIYISVSGSTGDEGLYINNTSSSSSSHGLWVNRGANGYAIYATQTTGTYPTVYSYSDEGPSFRAQKSNFFGSASNRPLIDAWRNPIIYPGISTRVFSVDSEGDVQANSYGSSPDFAEMIRVTSGATSVEPGDVMMLDPANPRSVLISDRARSSLVAGIYSTDPGVIGSERSWNQEATDPNTEPKSHSLKSLAEQYDEIPMAMIGIVPCKVSAENGSIAIGDLLVTSETPGHAMRDDNPRVGTVVGKALGSLASGTGVIKVLVTLQ